MTDETLQLLTAAVDGELTPAEQWQVHRLLVESVEARSVLARLQSDSIRVRNLPQANPPANLTARVMGKLPKAEPARESIRRKHSRSWQHFAIAASLFLAIGTVAFLAFKKPGNAKHPGQQIAQNQPNFNEVLPRENAPLSVPPILPAPASNQVAQNTPPVVPETPSPVEVIPLPRVKGSDVLASPPVPIPTLDRMMIHMPLLVSVADLDRDDLKQKLAEELGRESAYRIDLFARDASRAAEIFQTVAKSSGLNLHTDANAADRMKKKQASAYVVYTESLTAAEIRDLLANLASDDAKNTQRVFDTLHATPALNSDHTMLKELLGIDPVLWMRSAAKPDAGTPSEPKPISAGTGDQIAKTLTAPKPGEKNAVLLSFTPAAVRTNPALSKELKEFLARRGERKASAVPILIVIRQPNG